MEEIIVCEKNCNHDDKAVCIAKGAMLPESDVQRLAEMFKILGDPTRIKILHALTGRELCVCDLAETIGMGQSAISHQLRMLKGYRLVKYRKEGKEVIYSLDDAHILGLLCMGLDHINHS